MKFSIKINNLIILLLFLLIIFLIYLINIKGYQDVSAIIFFTLLFLLILYLSDIGFLIKNLMTINFLLSLLYSYYMYSNNIINFPDTLYYFDVLNKIVSSNDITLKSVINYAGSLHIGYHYLNYFIFKIFNSKYALYLINIVMEKISIIFLYYHLKKRYGKRVSVLTTILLIMSTHLFVFTSHILKDSFILFLSMLSLFIYDKYVKDRKPKQVIGLIIILSFLTMTRIYSGVGLSLGLFIDYIVLNNKKIRKKNIFVFAVFFVSLLLISPLNAYLNLGLNFLRHINLSIGFFVSIIGSTISLFLSPFFWNLTQEFTVYSPIILDSMFLLIFSPLLIIHFYKLLKYKDYRNKMYIYIIPIFIHVLTLSVQYGKTPTRQKIAVYPFIIFLYVFELCKILPISKYENKK